MNLSAHLFVFLQRLLPKQLLTTLVSAIAGIRHGPFKNFLIRRFVAHFDVDVTELARPAPEGFASFNDFFTRELAADARPLAVGDRTLISPVDGMVSAVGRIEGEQIFQAKGMRYTLTDLLAANTEDKARFDNGSFATLYLAPFNYHRVHAPLAGNLTSALYVPGTLFSVNDTTVSLLPQLFARNERLVCHADAEAGPFALIFVGALNVGTIYSRWTGDIRPKSTGVAELQNITAREDLAFNRGELLGWFNMGSTVILLLPEAAGDPFAGLKAGQIVRMGEALGEAW